MASSDEEDSDFVVLGTSLPDIDDDAEAKKPKTIADLTARDKQGRRRFHGAFTGGFSAGYFNTVGTKEGFTPSTFVSSRNRKPGSDDAESTRSAQPEDFMDDEDLEEHGIAPRKFATAGNFTSEERKRKRVLEEKQNSGSSSILDVGHIISDLAVSGQLTVGMKLLRKMGWRDGQGLGPRKKQKKKKSKEATSQSQTGIKVYGCARPPSDDEDSSEEFIPEDMSQVTFAPKDVTPISLEPKENLHGLGYRGLDPSLALPGSHVNLFSTPVHSKPGRKGISGQAFGVGAFEDDDEDIYAVDSMSNYDMTMQLDETGDNKFGWTAPQNHGKQQVPVNYVGKLLEGFCLSKKQLKPKKKFPPPTLPKHFRPYHWFRKSRELSHIPAHLREGSDGSKSKTPLTAVDRGILLGETPVMESVFDLIPKTDRDRIDATKEAISMTKSLTSSQTEQHVVLDSSTPKNKESVSTSQDKLKTSTTMANDFMSRFKPAAPAEADTTSVKQDTQNQQENARTTQPLFRGGLTFQPFRKNKAKQKRYDHYLALLKEGVQEPYNSVADPHMTEWERASERDEFSKASKMYRPMSAMMSSRFVSGTMIDDDMMDTAQDSSEKTDEAKAAEMKMFGKLTREEFEWHPHQLLCKRFNVPNPYPGSDIVGVPGVKRDKYSVFNFLSMGDFQAGTTQEPSTSAETQEKEDESAKKTLVPNKSKRATMASIFKVLDDPDFHNPVQAKKNTDVNLSLPHQSNEPTPAESTASNNEDIDKDAEDEEPAADLDLFRAIFKNSDSEDSEDNQKEDDETVVSSDADGAHSSKGEQENEGTGGVAVAPEIKMEQEDSTNDDQHPFPNLFSRKSKNSNLQNVAPSMLAESTNNDVQGTTPETDKCPEHGHISNGSSSWKNSKGIKSVFSVLDEMESQSKQSGEQDIKSRLTGSLDGRVQAMAHADDNDDDAYGPSLPPPVSFKTTTDTPNPIEKSRGRSPDRHHKREHKSSHRKEKKRKSKNRKEKKHRKHKKSSKSRSKSRKRDSSSGSEADTESDSASSVSDSELLERLRAVSKSAKRL